MSAKYFALLCLLSLGISIESTGGCPCNNIVTPAVPRPESASIVSSTCSTLVISWKGLKDQEYVVRVSYLDPATKRINEMEPIKVAPCGDDEYCTASIPVSAGRQVTWTVQGVRVEGDRTYYSYPLRGGQNYPVPVCDNATLGVNGHGGPGSQGAGSGVRMIVFPNPVHTMLNIAFSKPVTQTQLRIFDMNGKTVLAQQTSTGDVQINVSSLSNGNYLAVVEESSGRTVYTASFVKN